MCRVILFFILVTSGLHSFAEAKQITVDSLASDDVKELVNIMDQDSLVLICINEVITTPRSNMFRASAMQNRYFIDNLVTRSKDSPMLKKILINWFTRRQVILVEPEWPSLIETMKNSGALVYGLSMLDANIYNIIGNIEEWRYKELKSFNIEFTQELNSKQLLPLAKLQNKQANFYNGIVFAGPLGYAQIIPELIKAGNLHPKKIIVFADSESNLKKIERSLMIFDIDLHTVLYQASSYIEGKPDMDLIQFQQKKLLTEGVWLEDEEARAAFK